MHKSKPKIMGQTKSEKVQYPNTQVVVYGCIGVVGDKLYDVQMCLLLRKCIAPENVNS